MRSGIAPWWQRGWQGFWTNQRTALRLEDPEGTYDYDERRHEVRWQGCLRANDGRRWPLEVRWGPGTPFLPPRIYLDTVYSRVHQLRDGSLCLAHPEVSEVMEISAWLEQTRTWMDRYVKERWSISEAVWQVQRLSRPDPGYRLHERPKAYLLVPADWLPAGAHGEFFARLPPAGGGLGTLLRWREPAEPAWNDWTEGAVYAPPGGEELPGYWLHESDGTIREPLAAWLAHPERQHTPWLLGRRLRVNETTSTWQFVRCDPRRAKPLGTRLVPVCENPADRIAAQMALHSYRAQQILPGLPLASDAIAVRAKVSRSKQMDTRIRDACVVIIGLGALGSEVAHLLAKEQVGRFILIDGDLMLPGNVARHRLDLCAVGGNKAEKMREHLLRHHPGASVEVVAEMLDEALPRLKLPDQALLLGLTGDIPSERILAALAAERGMPCVHAWTECEGRLLRLIRALPGRDAGLHEIRELPAILWPTSGATAAHCGELLQPGSSINLHAAANRTARLALEVLGDTYPSSLSRENHILFTAEGVDRGTAGIPPELRSPYGQLYSRLDLRR